MSMDVLNLTICMMNHFRLRGYLFCMLLQLLYYFSRIVHPGHTVPISPLLHCPPLPHRAYMSTPAFSTPPFLTVPFCPLPQIPSTHLSYRSPRLDFQLLFVYHCYTLYAGTGCKQLLHVKTLKMQQIIISQRVFCVGLSLSYFLICLCMYVRYSR